MDVIVRLPDAGQAADAKSAYSQIKKWKTLQNYWSFQSQNVQIFGYVFHDTSGQSLGQTSKILWFFLNEICVVTHLSIYCGKDNLEKKNKIPLGLGWDKIPHWQCLFVHRKQDLFLSEFVDDIKMVGTKQNLSPMWKKLVYLGEPTSFLDHVYTWDVLSANANRTRILVRNAKRLSNHESLIE